MVQSLLTKDVEAAIAGIETATSPGLGRNASFSAEHYGTMFSKGLASLKEPPKANSDLGRAFAARYLAGLRHERILARLLPSALSSALPSALPYQEERHSVHAYESFEDAGGEILFDDDDGGYATFGNAPGNDDDNEPDNASANQATDNAPVIEADNDPINIPDKAPTPLQLEIDPDDIYVSIDQLLRVDEPKKDNASKVPDHMPQDATDITQSFTVPPVPKSTSQSLGSSFKAQEISLLVRAKSKGPGIQEFSAATSKPEATLAGRDNILETPAALLLPQPSRNVEISEGSQSAHGPTARSPPLTEDNLEESFDWKTPKREEQWTNDMLVAQTRERLKLKKRGAPWREAGEVEDARPQTRIRRL